MRLQDPARPTRASKGPKPGPDSRRHQQRTRVRGRKLGPVSLECCLGHDGGCAGRQGGEEQDDAHEPAAGVVCAVSGTPDRRADECRDRGRASAECRAWARRDRMWGRLLERSRWLGPFGEGVGVVPPPVPRKAGALVLLHVRRGALQTQAYASEDASPSASGPRRGVRIAAVARPMRLAEMHARAVGRAAQDACSACDKGPRLGSRRRRHRVLRNAGGVGRQGHGCPRSVWPSANTAEHHDHRSGLGVDQASVVALHRRAVCSCRIGERRVGAGAAIRVQRATEHHP